MGATRPLGLGDEPQWEAEAQPHQQLTEQIWEAPLAGAGGRYQGLRTKSQARGTARGWCAHLSYLSCRSPPKLFMRAGVGSKRGQLHLPFDPTRSFLSLYPTELRTDVHRKNGNRRILETTQMAINNTMEEWRHSHVID